LLRAQISTPEFQQRKSAATEAVQHAVERHEALQALLAETHVRVFAEQEADALAASLASLIEHGARLGLADGHCPLCAAPRTAKQFEDGLARASARLETLGSGVGAARQARAAAEQAVSESERVVANLRKQLSDIIAEEERLRQREVAHIALIGSLELEPSVIHDLAGLERQRETEHNRLIELERAIITVESSQSIQQISNLEERVSMLRRDVDVASM